jgi:hypothetical protein
MTTDNIEEIKTALAAMKERETPTRRSTIHAEDQSAAEQSDLAELESLLAANPDLGKLGEILARRDKRRESLLAQQHRRPDAQETQAAATAATAAIKARRQALSILSQPFTPPYYVTLDTPVAFLELPHADFSILQDSGITPGWSWVTARLDTNHSPDGYMTGTSFQFYFLWQNPSDNYAVVNVSSSLYLRGSAGASGSWAILSGNTATLSVTAYLDVVRWSGWGTDPDTGQSNDQTPYPGGYSQTTAAYLQGFGGDLFDSAQPEQATFSLLNPYGVSASLIAIPGQAWTMFEVGLQVGWGFGGATGQDQSVVFDIATDGGVAGCPFVQIEVLTGPPT